MWQAGRLHHQQLPSRQSSKQGPLHCPQRRCSHSAAAAVPAHYELTSLERLLCRAPALPPEQPTWCLPGFKPLPHLGQ
jgi:hypothetical protein